MSRAQGFVAFALLIGSAACSFPEVSYLSGGLGGGGDGGDGGAGNPGGGPMQGGGGTGGEGAATSTNTSTSTGMGGGQTCTDEDGDKYVVEADNGACLPPDYFGYGDCDDKNSSVYPNQTTFFNSPRPSYPPGSEEAWNYDCNGSLDLLFEVGCESGFMPKDGLEVSDGVSGCGDTGMWRAGGPLACNDVEERIQGCR